MKKEKNILKIYIDETGDNSNTEIASYLYGFSFVFYETKNDISDHLNRLEYRLTNLNDTGMFHTMELIKGKGKYFKMDVNSRRKLFNTYFKFYELSPIKSKSFFIKKKETIGKSDLNKKLSKQLNNFIINNYEYLSSFDEVQVFYDAGQDLLKDIFKDSFSILRNYKPTYKFDKTQERLFQVADMITFLDRLYFKIKNNIQLSNSEKNFFLLDDIKKIIKKLDKKSFK